jgi:hypothetical protein
VRRIRNKDGNETLSNISNYDCIRAGDFAEIVGNPVQGIRIYTQLDAVFIKANELAKLQIDWFFQPASQVVLNAEPIGTIIRVPKRVTRWSSAIRVGDPVVSTIWTTNIYTVHTNYGPVNLKWYSLLQSKFAKALVGIPKYARPNSTITIEYVAAMEHQEWFRNSIGSTTTR